MKFRSCIALTAFLLSPGCLAKAGQQIGTADMVLYNGAVYTVSPSRSWATAVAIKEGEIV